MEALGYFPEGHERLVELLGKEPTHHAPVAGLVIAKYPPSKLLTHPNELVRFRAARHLVFALSRPKDNDEIARVLRVTAREVWDELVAREVFSALAGKLGGEVPISILDALVDAVDHWACSQTGYAMYYVNVIASYTQYPRLRARAIDALKRLAKINNSVGHIAVQKLCEIG